MSLSNVRRRANGAELYILRGAPNDRQMELSICKKIVDAFSFRRSGMLFHEKRKYVFISVPKTGTSAVEKHITGLDQQVCHNTVKKSDGQWVRVAKHASARQIKCLLGEQADQFRFVAFFRDPRELVLAKYNWYRNGLAYKRWKNGRLPFFTPNHNWWKPSLAHRVLFARFLPFSIWLRFYPFKPNAHFVANIQGQLDVDFFGLFENLQRDFIRIFTNFGYAPEQLTLPRENVTKYENYSADLDLVDRIVRNRCGQDLALIEEWKARNGGL